MNEKHAVEMSVKGHRYRQFMKYSGMCISCGTLFYSSSPTALICSARCKRGQLVGANWKGGWFKSSDGYIKISGQQDHPRVSSNGVMCEHTIIMEKHLGRYLHKDEKVHHKNGIKSDNRIENLELMTSHPPGQRIEDIIMWIINNYPEMILSKLKDKGLISDQQ